MNALGLLAQSNNIPTEITALAVLAAVILLVVKDWLASAKWKRKEIEEKDNQLEVRNSLILELTQKSYDMASQFDQTVSESMARFVESIEKLYQENSMFRATWLEGREEWRKAVEVISTKQNLDDEEAKAFRNHVKAEHEAMIHTLDLINEALCKVCERMDINGKKWDGTDRRQGGGV